MKVNPFQVHGRGKEDGAMKGHTETIVTFDKAILGECIVDQLVPFMVSLCLLFSLNGILESCSTY